MTTDARDAHLSDAQRALLAGSRALARDTFAPLTARTPETGRVDRALVRSLADHGLLDRLFTADPAANGGWRGDVSAIDLCLVREGLAHGATAAETAFAMQGLGSFALLAAGTPEAIARWIPDVAAGRAVAAFALSEPQAGSDVAALSLRAERDGDGWVLSGRKTWISNAPDADLYTVLARTTEGAGARGLSAFAVPGDAPGLSGEPLQLLSPHPIGRLHFDDVPVAREQLIGEVDGGMAVAMRTLDLFRPSVGAFALGMAQAALELTIAYVQSRDAFGGPLAGKQAVAHRIADVATRVQAARLLVHSAANAHDAGVRPTTQVAAMAKLMATEVAQEAVDVAVQLHGAVALERGHPLEHLYRDVRAPRIYEGASEIQREIIARGLLQAGRGG